MTRVLSTGLQVLRTAIGLSKARPLQCFQSNPSKTQNIFLNSTVKYGFCMPTMAKINQQPSSQFHTSVVDLSKNRAKYGNIKFRDFYDMDQHIELSGLPNHYRKRRSKMWGQPHIKGIVTRLLIRKPKKPNSANRKCCKVRLSNGREIIAYIPGIGHSLQEHNVVLIEGARKKDLPGVHHKVVRGKYDCAHVIKS